LPLTFLMRTWGPDLRLFRLASSGIWKMQFN
jgi:hypothetical protein